MRNVLLIALIILTLSIPISYGLAASYGEGRVTIRTEVPEGETVTIDRSIRVKNANDIPVKVTFEPVGNFKKIIEMFDKEVILQPEEMKRAYFRITLRSGGRYEGKIIITFSPEDPTIVTNSAGGSSAITILAEGPVNEHYYEVMGNNKEETEEEPEEEESITGSNTISIEGDYNQSESIEIEDTEILESPFEESTDTETNKKPLIGAAIVVFIVVAGVGIFLIINKMRK